MIRYLNIRNKEFLTTFWVDSFETWNPYHQLNSKTYMLSMIRWFVSKYCTCVLHICNYDRIFKWQVFCTVSFLRICSSWWHDFTTRCFVINSIFTHECALLWKFSKNFNFIKLCFHTSINTHGKRTELRMKKNSHGHNFYLSTMGWNPFCANIFLSLYIFMKRIILLLHKSIWDKFYVQKIIFFLYK